MIKAIALAAIRFYQRYLSPYKGYCCAYRVHTGCAGCSGLGYRAVRRYGFWSGIGVLRKRLYLCGVAYRRYAAVPPLRSRQAGFCDFLACDLPAAGCADMATPGCDAACCAGDFLTSRKANEAKEDEAKVYLPPKPQPSRPADANDSAPSSAGGWKG